MKYVVSSSVVKYNYCKNEATDADEMHTRITNSFGGRGTLVVNKVWHDVKAAVKEAEAQLITGAPEDFEAGFEALAQRLEDLNCERACEIRQAIYQRWLAR